MERLLDSSLDCEDNVKSSVIVGCGCISVDSVKQISPRLWNCRGNTF